MSDTISPWIGLAIKRLRQFHGMSQGELAAKAEITQAYVSKIERASDNLNVNLGILSRLANVFDIRLSDLIRKAEDANVDDLLKSYLDEA